MLVTTGNDVAGYEVAEYLGVVRGIIVRSTGLARGFIGGIKSIAGGNSDRTAQCRDASSTGPPRVTPVGATIVFPAIAVSRVVVGGRYCTSTLATAFPSERSVST